MELQAQLWRELTWMMQVTRREKEDELEDLGYLRGLRKTSKLD